MRIIKEDCIERSRNQTGKANIPNTAIAATSNKLQMPSLEEGIDELYFVIPLFDAVMLGRKRGGENVQ